MGPTHDLDDIKAKIRIGYYFITLSASTSAHALGFDGSDIRDCVLGTDRSHFYKSMPSEMRPGSMQDVYRTQYLGAETYLKLQLATFGRAVIISLKPWT